MSKSQNAPAKNAGASRHQVEQVSRSIAGGTHDLRRAVNERYG